MQADSQDLYGCGAEEHWSDPGWIQICSSRSAGFGVERTRFHGPPRTISSPRGMFVLETMADSQCMPILISLETSELVNVSDKALALHTHLHNKHASLVNIRYLDFAKASYEYQRSITSEVSGYRHGEALLQGWYSLISEKRAWRTDLLRSFIRAFDYDVSKRDTVS